jgi:alkylhydroperoxidase family enzyme
MSYRLQPLQPPFDEVTETLFDRYPKRDGYLLSLFRVFANSRRFLEKGTLNLLDRESPLTMRLREVVILRVTGNFRCEYEWGVHVAAFGDHVGFTGGQIADTLASKPTPDLWDPTERLLLEVVDGLCMKADLGRSLLDAFQAEFDQAQQLEVMALVGNYHTVSNVANVARLPAEPFAAVFPSPAAERRRAD